MCALGVLVIAGCQESAPGDLKGLTEDANNNGFPEVPPPQGVTFEEFGSLNVAVSSEFTTQDAAEFLESIGLDPGLVNIGTLTLEIDLTLDYGNGITDTLQETETLEPFLTQFEIACPPSATLDINALASAPFFPSQSVAQFQFELQEGDEYMCGDTIEAMAIANEGGTPGFEVNVIPQ